MNKVVCTIILLGIVLGLRAQIDRTDSIRVTSYLQKSDSVYNLDVLQSEKYLDSALRIAEKMDWQWGIAKIRFEKCRTILTAGDVERGNTNINKAIAIFEKLGDDVELAHAYSLKSIIHGRLKEYDKSIELLEKAVQLNIKTNNLKGLATCYVNLGMEYVRTGQFEKAEQVLLKSHDITVKEGFESSGFYSHLNLGNLYFLTNRLIEAKMHLEKAMETGVKFNNTDGVVSCMNMLGNLYVAMGEPEKAQSYYMQCLNKARAANLPMEESEVLLDMSKFYSQRREFEKALSYYQNYKSIEDSLYNIEKIKKVTQLEKQLDLNKKELLIKDQNAMLTAANLEVEHEKKLLIVVFCAVLALLVLLVFTVKNLLDKRKANAILEENRIAMLEINEELNQQNEEIGTQRDYIEEQRKLLETKNKDVLDSIAYAKRIQEAMLPETGILHRNFSEYFVFYSPKDIVSGDFYWIHETAESLYLAVVDCTGHGVPGAFVSLVAHNRMHEIVKEFKDISSGDFLTRLSTGIAEALNANKNAEQVKDGMDMSLCKFSKGTGKLEYSGANSSIYLITDKKQESSQASCRFDDDRYFYEFKATKRAIGYGDNHHQFSSVEISLEQGDCLYLFSDGYADQFGGGKGKKLNYRRFREELYLISNQAMIQQQEHLRNFFNGWRKHEEQVDDVCVIGVRL